MKFNIKFKVALFTIFGMSILAIVIGAIGYVQYNDNVFESYLKYATLATETAGEVFDDYGIGDMVANRTIGDRYEEARLELNRIKEHADIKYLYGVYFEDINDFGSLCYVINAKSAAELAPYTDYSEVYSYLGEKCEDNAFSQEMMEGFKKKLETKDDTVGYLESYTTHYGRIVTCYKTIFDSKGDAVAIVATDIDLTKIDNDLHEYVLVASFNAILVVVMIIAIYIFFINKNITDPIEKMAKSTSEYVKLMDNNVPPEQLVFDKIRVNSQDEIKTLSKGISSLADSVKDYMGNLQSVTAEKERIGAELNVATQIQADMLPRIFPPFPERTEFDLYASMTPAKEVGGDFYDFFLIDDDHVALVIADVSGKGVPAALFMVIAKTHIKNRAMMGGSPAEILSYANDQLCEGNEAEFFVTVWMAIIEISTGKGVAANAGHEHPVIKRADGKYELAIYKHSPAVATMEGMIFKEHEFELHPGDSLFVYTDGVPEATNADDVLYGTDRMLEALNKEDVTDPKVILNNVKKSVDEFVGDAPQFDDLTMLGFHYNGGKNAK